MGACFLYGKTGNGASGKKVPKFTYTGDYKIEDGETENWKVRFLTGGTLVFKSTPPAIDVFCVGGGAGGQRNEDSGYDPCRPGGGGGYTKTTKNVAVKKGESYQIVIGAGGAGLDYVKGGSYGNNGGATTAFGCTAKGGYAAYAGLGLLPGGNGGSGGGGAGGAGGSNGGNGVGSKTTDAYGNGIPTNCRGQGQGTTTKAFGEADGELFAGGGGGSWNNERGQPGGTGGGGDAWKAGAANTGGGGGCCASGGSGIVIIRAFKEA